MTASNFTEKPNPFVVKHFQRLQAALALSADAEALNLLASSLADRLVPRLEATLGVHGGSPWLRRAGAAAEYLGCPRSRIYDLVARGELEHEHDGSRSMGFSPVAPR
jgi:hypothetical protein